MGNLGAGGITEKDISEFEVLPTGKYRMICIRSEIKDSSNESTGTSGAFADLRFQAVDEGVPKVLVFVRCFLSFDGGANDAATVRMGRSELAKIAKALKIVNPKDTSELENKELYCEVDIEEYNGKKKNVIKSYSSVDDYVPGEDRSEDRKLDDKGAPF